jgi:hypothetical protein
MLIAPAATRDCYNTIGHMDQHLDFVQASLDKIKSSSSSMSSRFMDLMFPTRRLKFLLLGLKVFSSGLTQYGVAD